MKMLVVSKRTFRPYDDSQNPRYKQKPILSTIFETIYIKIPVQQIPFSRCDDISNAFSNETQNELNVRKATTRASHSHQSHSYQKRTQPKFKSANSSCSKSTIAYYAQELTRHKYNKKYNWPLDLRIVNYVEALNLDNL